MALNNGLNQGDNPEPTKIEQVTGIENAQDLTDVKPIEEVKMLEADNISFAPATAEIDPPVKGKPTSSLMTSDEAEARRIASGNNSTTTVKPDAPKASGFLATLGDVSKPDTSISRPIDQSVDFSQYKDYLSKNNFYFDSKTGLDKQRALNQSNWEQAAYATTRTLLNVVPEGIKQVANAFDFEDWSAANAETGNWVSDAMTSMQESVKGAMPIYRENPGESLDVGDFAYWMETGDSLVTSIGGFVLAGYALGGAVGIGAKGIAGIGKIGSKVQQAVSNSTSFRNAIAAAESRGIGEAGKGLAVNYLMNRAESIGIGAEVYANVYEKQFNAAILEGKTEEQAKVIAKEKAARGAAASMNFNAINMALNTTSSQLFLKSAKAATNLVKKGGVKQLLSETGKEATEEYINDLGQIYGENVDTDTPLTFKKAAERLTTAEGLEAPILGAIGGFGQTALTKAGKYIQTSDNESYMRHFNQYIMDNPITGENKETVIQSATAFAQQQANKDKGIGIFTNRNNAGGQQTSTAQQLESLYVAQQAALQEYDKADKADNMNDVVNSTLSSQFSVDLMNQLESDATITPEQKDNLLERTLLSHQAYKALKVGTLSELKSVYQTYANMDETTAKERGILTDEVVDDKNHYKNKANRALKTLDAYEQNYRISNDYINSSEVYTKLNHAYFNDRDVTERSEAFNSKVSEVDKLSLKLFESEGDKEALDFYNDAKATSRTAIHPKLEGTKIEEELLDLRRAIKVAKDNQLDNRIELERITSVAYNRDLAETIKLYRNKQIAEANKAKANTATSGMFSKMFNGAKKTAKRKTDKEEETTSTTTQSSTTGNSQQTTTPTPVVPTKPAKPAATTNTVVTSGTTLPTLFAYDTNGITGSPLMQDYINGDTANIKKILNSAFSLETKIQKVKDSIDAKVNYDAKNMQALAPDGESVIGLLVERLQGVLERMESHKVNLAPDVVEANETFAANVTDFALDLEESRLLAPEQVDEEGNTINNSKEVVDANYKIYSSILEQMSNRGIDTNNFEEVMTEFNTILGSRLLKSEFNSLQGLFNFVNNTKEARDYKDLFSTLSDIDNDADNESRLAKVTLPSGKFIYDIDETSRIAMQATRQTILLNNPHAEVKGLAYPIYNETGGDLLAYLSQEYIKVSKPKVNKDGEPYTKVDKETVTGLINAALDPSVLEDNFFKVDAEITFVPLDSYKDDAGNTVLADALPVGEKPIGVVMNGTLIKGVYLHNVSWITAENLNNTPEGIEQDRANLLILRNRIIKGEDVKTKISSVSPGAPITNAEGRMSTFASEFMEFPVGVVKDGELHTPNEVITIPAYMSFNEGAVVTKVNDYFYYGERTQLFRPIRNAIITSLKAFATGVHNDGTQSYFDNNGIDLLKGKGLENYFNKLVNTTAIKIGKYYPTDLDTFKEALATRPETEVVVNIIKGDFYIGRGGAIDVITLKASQYKNDPTSLDMLLVEVDTLLLDSYANVDLGSLASNTELQIIREDGIEKTFETYDNYVKHVSSSIYGSIVLPSGNKITTIQKRVNFETPNIAAEANNTPKTVTNTKAPKKAKLKPIKTISPTGVEQITLFGDLDVKDDFDFENITDEDFAPDVVDLAPATTEPLTSPSLIPGISNNLQKVIVQDIVLDYYGRMLEAKKNKSELIKLEDFFDAKVSLFVGVLAAAYNREYKGYDKMKEQVITIKANKAKFLEIARQNITRQLGVTINEGSFSLENTNDDVNSNEEGIDSPDGNPIDESTERSRIYDANEFGLDPKLDMSNAVKYLLYGIEDAQMVYEEVAVKDVVNGVETSTTVRRPKIIARRIPLQLPIYVNPDVVYQDLIKLFSKSSTNDGMNTTDVVINEKSELHPKIQVAIGVLSSKLNTKPYYANIIAKLQKLDMQTQLQFIKTFNKNNTDHIKIIEWVSKDGESLSLRPIKNSTQNALLDLIQKWTINLKSIGGYVPGDDGMYLNPEVYKAFVTGYNNIAGNKDYQTYANFRQLFAFIGIRLPEAAFDKLRDGVFIDNKPKTLHQQFGHTQGYLKRIKDRVDTMMTGGPNGTALPIDTLYEDSSFKEFGNFLLEFDDTAFNTAYRNGNGDTIWGVTNNRYFMERIIGLKNNAGLLKNLFDNVFSSKSSWLHSLYSKSTGTVNKGEFHLDFNYNTLDSYTVRATNKTKMVDSLNRKELIQLSLSLFYNQGLTRFKKTIPVHKFIIPALSDKSNMFVVQAQGRFYNLTNGRLSTNDLTFLRTQLFEGEYHRVVKAAMSGDIGKKGYDTGANKFLMFPKFNTIDGLWINGVINPAALQDEAVMTEVDNVIMEYVKASYMKTYSDWGALELLKEGKDNVYTDKMQYIDTHYAAINKGDSRNTLQEASSVALNYTVNYLVANANMQQLLFNDPAFYYKKGKKDSETGVEISTDIAETWDNATKRYAAVNGGKDEFHFPAGSKFNVLSINDTGVKSTTLDYLSTLWAGHPDHDNHMAKYSEMESGDAQEYTSLGEHLDRMVYSGTLNASIAKRILKTYNETGKVSKADLDTVLIPFKPLYFNTYMAESGVMETLYIKTSSLPLIKELTEGTDLDALREYLDNPRNKVNVAVFASGIKAGNPTSSLKLFNEDGSIISEALKGNIDAHIIKNIPREGHGNQQANPDKSNKQEVNDGTQQAKLLFTNILNVLGFKNPFATSKEDAEVSGRTLAKEYLNRYEKRFEVQYQKLMKELDVQNGIIGNVGKLQKILTKEAIGRGWTFNEAASFELDASGLNFEIPLWMSISSNKIESLLSSIVDNRIRKRKRRGRAYILASDAGVRVFDYKKDTSETGIVFTDDFTGELRNTFNDKGVMTSAEILVPFRFYNNEGKLLKITDFMKDGKLDTTKLPAELLEAFGFRIPTSGVNLMNSIKIVGFLPESYGDAVIAPADFTVQMGSDFDVDKFYTNTFATYFDKTTGKLEKLTQRHIQARKAITDSIFELTSSIKRYKNYKGKKKDFLIKEARAAIKIEQSKPLYKVEDLDILVLDNEITEIQRAVLNNPAKEVQRARTKPLSFGRLVEMVQKFGDKDTDANFTFLNRDVQDKNYLNGNLGKTAVGNFSLDMIFNSLGQYIETPVFFQNKVAVEGGYKYYEAKMKAFGFKSNDINNPLLNDGSGRYKSDVLEGLMAASLDNGKEQILGKLGIGSNTFDFIRAMVATGYNEEIIIGILAQPVVKLYLSPTTKMDLKVKIEQAVRGLSKKDTFLGEFELSRLTEELSEFDVFLSNTDNISKALTNSVKAGKISDTALELQVGAMALFMRMEKRGQTLSQLRSALNVDSAGVGKNIIYSAAKLEQAEMAKTNPGINNAESYFVATSINPETGNTVKDYATIGQSALFYGANTNSMLWSRYFPFDNAIIKKLVTTIAERTGKDIFRLNSYSDYATLILKEFKSFLSAIPLNSALPSFMKNATSSQVLKAILHESPSHQSLGSFIAELRTEGSSSIKYSNDLLNSLTIDTVETSLLSDNNPAIINISYNNISRLDNSENDVVNSFIDMINNPTPLGVWNGHAITSKDLANLLISYQLLSKGIPSATKFIQFIPTTYLKQLGYYDSMSKAYRDFVTMSASKENDRLVPQFLIQHMQHNMADYYDASIAKKYEGSFENGIFIASNFKDAPNYIVFKDANGYHIQYKTKAGFIRINPLGWGNNSEYNHEVLNPISINFKNNISQVNVRVAKLNEDVKVNEANVVTPSTGIISSQLGYKTVIDIPVSEDVATGEAIIKEFPAYTLQMTDMGSREDFYLVKNGSRYNTIYHRLTNVSIPIEGLTATTTKVERDVKIMEALSLFPSNVLDALGLGEDVETISIATIESNIEEFMTPTRDRTEDVFPVDINNAPREFAEELGLDNNTLSLQDKYALIFDRIRDKSGNRSVLGYFLSAAREILPLMGNTPIVIDTTLKSRGAFISTNGDGYIVINPNKFKTVEEMAAVIAEEAIHSIFKKQVRVKNPIVKDLEKLRKEIEAGFVEEYGQEAIDIMKAKVANGEALVKGVESELLYSIYNVDEFIAAVLTKPAFQTYLNSKDMDIANKTLWEKLIELLSGILKVLGVRMDSQLSNALGGILALTNDIRDNHLKNVPKSKYQRSLEFINDRFNLVSEMNSLLPKGNASAIAEFINNNFANVTATVVEGKYVETMPTNFIGNSETNADYSPDIWDIEGLNIELTNSSTTKELRANYFQYASSLRARVIQGEKLLNKAKVVGDSALIEEAQESLLADKVDLMNIPKLQSLTDFEMKAKEDLAKVNKVLDNPMSSEDIIYARNILNFWTKAREFSFTEKHRESESLMRTYGIIEDDATTATKRLQLIEKKYLEDFIANTIGRDVTLDDMFKNYKDVDIVTSNLRDISTYDNALLNSIWKRVQYANMEAEQESETLLKKLNSIITKVMPKLKAINSSSPYEIFRQLSENGLKTNHLINAYSTKFYNDRSRAYNLAKEGQNHATVNNYANWVKGNTKALKVEMYFPSNSIITPQVEANRDALKAEVGEYVYNIWFNGQNRKINAYNKRKSAIEAVIKDSFKMDSSADIKSNPEALTNLENWAKKHSPYEFSNVVNSASYKYYPGTDGLDGFQSYEVMPNKPEHLNKDFEVIAKDPELLEFYHEFSAIYESLKVHVPSSQFANLIYGGLPVIEQSIYQAFSTGGLKAGFKGIRNAWTNSVTSSFKGSTNSELDLVTGQNSKQMHIPGVSSNSDYINHYIKTKTLAHEVKTGKLATYEQKALYREEAVNELAAKGDFDLGKLMKVFGTLVVAHKHIAAIEDLIKIGQYTLNGYKEFEINPDGSNTTGAGGRQATLPTDQSFVNTKKSFSYFIDSQVYGNVKVEEGKTNTKKLNTGEKDLKTQYNESLVELEDKFAKGEVTEEFYKELKSVIQSNIDKLGSNVVMSKVGDNWLKYVQLKLMGWNILGGFSNSAFGFIGNMIEASGGAAFDLSEMNAAYRATTASVAKNLSFDKWAPGESSKIRNAMDGLNVLKEASHELFTTNDSTTFEGKFKFASPYNMNQRTEYLNQAPIMIILAKKTMVDTIGGRISIWEGMNDKWEWNTEKYGAIPTAAILDMRVKINKHIQRIHGNYDPASPLMIKDKFAGRALSQFRTWLYESVATRFEKERFEDGIGLTVKGRYRTLGGIIFENEGRINIKEGGIEFSKALLNNFTFGMLKMKSFENTKLSEIDSQNMRKIAMELVLLLDVYILIALLKAGLSDDDDEAKAMYNVLLNQGTRLKSDLLLYVNPGEARNILKDIVPSASLYDDIANFFSSITKLQDDEIGSGVHKGNSRFGTAVMKLLPGASKAYSTYNAGTQIYDKDIKIDKD